MAEKEIIEYDGNVFSIKSTDAKLARAVKANGVISIGGQFAPAAGEGLEEMNRLNAQAEEVFARVIRLAEAGGASKEDFTMVNLYLRDETYLAGVEQAWAKHFGKDNPLPRMPAVVSFPNPKSLVAVTATAVDPSWVPGQP